MELSSKQQIFEVIKKSKKFLISTKDNPSEDAVSAMIALGLYLEKNGKEVDLITTGPVPDVLSFLPRAGKIRKDLAANKNFVISLDTSQINVDQFSYDFDKDNKKLNIYITPEGGAFTKDHISTDVLGFGYDTIIALNCADFEKLGELYTKNSDLFYETEVINIDFDSANEQYGEVNLVNTTASSVSEVIYDLLENFDEKSLDKNIATCLLTGIISSTKSFQGINATPQSFAASAKLISYGADRQSIINNLYKNKSLATLKLWGRVLARVKYDDQARIAWSLIADQDFVKSGAKSQDLDGIVDEIMGSVNNADVSLVIYEERAGDDKKIKALVKSNKPIILDNLSQNYKTPKHNDIIRIATKPNNLLEAEKDLVNSIKKIV
jgi:phosphoesterase RecJ-like protein